MKIFPIEKEVIGQQLADGLPFPRLPFIVGGINPFAKLFRNLIGLACADSGQGLDSAVFTGFDNVFQEHNQAAFVRM